MASGLEVVHYYPSMDPARGGPPPVIVELARAQRALGCRVTIASREVPISANASRLLEAGGVLDGHVGIACFANGPVPSLAGARTIKQLVARADVVHLHGLWDLAALAVAEAASRRGVPYVLTPHGMLNRWSMSQARTKKRIALRLGFGRMIRNAALLHALSARELELIDGLPTTSRVIVIANGVDVETFSPLPEPGEFRRAHPALGSDPFILFMSRLHAKKGLDLLAEALARVRREIADVRLVVIGPDDGARADFETRVAALGLADRVHLLGPIYDRMKFAALVDCAAYCLPSRDEGFSVAIVEAMACGAPTVITRTCNFEEPGRAGAALVVDLDVERIAEALVRVLADPAGARELGRRGRDFVFAGYTWPTIAERMLAAYATVARHSSDTPARTADAPA